MEGAAHTEAPPHAATAHTDEVAPTDAAAPTEAAASIEAEGAESAGATSCSVDGATGSGEGLERGA
eukprot:4460881-Prorocentrum_lima.AAC.1